MPNDGCKMTYREIQSYLHVHGAVECQSRVPQLIVLLGRAVEVQARLANQRRIVPSVRIMLTDSATTCVHVPMHD